MWTRHKRQLVKHTPGSTQKEVNFILYVILLYITFQFVTRPYIMDYSIMNEANRTLWFDTWIVITENSTSTRELLSQPRRLGVVLFGSVLTILVILVNLTLAISVSRKRKGVPKARPGVNWLMLNYTLAQLLVGAVVVPLNVQTELELQWGLGPALCRAWLLMQVFLAALAHWSCWRSPLTGLYTSCHHTLTITGWPRAAWPASSSQPGRCPWQPQRLLVSPCWPTLILFWMRCAR